MKTLLLLSALLLSSAPVIASPASKGHLCSMIRIEAKQAAAEGIISEFEAERIYSRCKINYSKEA